MKLRSVLHCLHHSKLTINTSYTNISISSKNPKKFKLISKLIKTETSRDIIRIISFVVFQRNGGQPYSQVGRKRGSYSFLHLKTSELVEAFRKYIINGLNKIIFLWEALSEKNLRRFVLS